MTYSQFIKPIQKQSTSLKQTQRVMMSPRMQQALKLLQAPILEISQMIEQELEQNPLLDYSDDTIDEEAPSNEELNSYENEIEEDFKDFEIKELSFEEENYSVIEYLNDDFQDLFYESDNYSLRRTSQEEKLKSFLESSIKTQSSLYALLLTQAREIFETHEEYQAAETIIYSINEKGFFNSNLKELAALTGIPAETFEKVLPQIKYFDPPGIAASNLKESLLIQLQKKNKTGTLAYKIIEKSYDELVNNKINMIASICHCGIEQVNYAIQNIISKLDLNPGGSIGSNLIQTIIPDIHFYKDEDGELKVKVRDDEIPQLKINLNYLKMLQNKETPEDAKEFIKQKFSSAKSLITNIFQRNDTLLKLGNLLLETQEDFFLNPRGKLIPMTMKSFAEAIEVHESTIARAVSNKYLSCDKGIFPLRFFFTSSLNCDDGSDISSKSVKDLISKLIEEENKMRPLSDESLSRLLKKKGITCARRTVAKYRMQLNVGNAHQRKKFI